MYGIKHYLPSPPDGEDEVTITQHIAVLKAESRKTRQDAALIKHLMRITLANRRQGIVTSHWTVTQTKEMYPCLFHEDEVSISLYNHTGLKCS